MKLVFVELHCGELKDQRLVRAYGALTLHTISQVARDDGDGLCSWLHEHDYLTEPCHHVLQWEWHDVAIGAVELLAVDVLAHIDDIHGIGSLEVVALTFFEDFVA